jgi:hypothetical protein
VEFPVIWNLKLVWVCFNMVLTVTYLLTYSMEQSPSWEADQSLQPVKKFPAFLWNPKVLYCTNKY